MCILLFIQRLILPRSKTHSSNDKENDFHKGNGIENVEPVEETNVLSSVFETVLTKRKLFCNRCKLINDERFCEV